jgi:predicted permease
MNHSLTYSHEWRTAMSGLLQDLRFAVRQIRKNPGATSVAVLTLALGIGVNTVIFDMANGFLLRPLPYPEPDRLAVLVRHQEGISPKTGQFVQEDNPSQDGETWEIARDHLRSVRLAIFGGTSGVNLASGPGAEAAVRYVQDMRVSAHYFEVLGIQPFMGRGFTEEEDRPGGPKAVVVSYSLWQSALKEDPQILGRQMNLKGEPYTVVGVLPRGAQSAGSADPQVTGTADLWTPLQPHQSGECGGENCEIIMRLLPGATWQQAATEISHLWIPSFESIIKIKGRAWFYASPLSHNFEKGMRGPVLMLMLAVGLILLIACANLAGLTLVRITQRLPEFATRLALGATRWDVLRQLWTENLVLAFLGAGAGLVATQTVLKILSGLVPESMIPVGGLSVDGRVVAFTSGIALLASLFFGALPALQVRRVELRSSIASGSHTVVRGSSRLRQVFVGTEVALTIILMGGAGLLIRTLVHLETIPPGFDANNVTTAKLSLDDARYKDAAAFHNLLQRSVSLMEQIPGVEDVAVGLSVPYERGLTDGVRILDGKLAGKEWGASTAYVTPGYFKTLRIPLVAGRVFRDADTPTSEFVTVINSEFAREFFGEPYPLGRHLRTEGHTYTVVGVVPNVAKRPGMDNDAPLGIEPVFYVPAKQMDQGIVNIAHVWFQPSWIVRTNKSGQDISVEMQKALAQVDPQLPFAGFYRMKDILSQALAYQRVEVAVLTVLAGLALLLSAVGIYGLVSNLVVQRRREIGLRLALGSTVRQVMLVVGSSGMRAVLAGLIAGMLGALLALRVLRSELYGVSSYDPVTFSVLPLVIAVTAAAASLLPTLRITRVDPAATLKAE